MAARQTVIIGGITLAAILAGVLWYQISTQPASQSTKKPTPSPRPASFSTVTQTPTATPTPLLETPRPSTQPVVPVQPSAATGPAESALMAAVANVILGGSLLFYTTKHVPRQ